MGAVVVGPGMQDDDPAAAPGVLHEQVEYYRARAGQYDAGVYAAPGAWLPADLLVGHTMPIQGAVLEIACGTGHWTKIISGREDMGSVTALDASPEMIEIARGKAPGRHLYLRRYL